MARKSTLRGVLSLFAVLAMIVAGSAVAVVSDADSGDIDVYQDLTVFEAATAATPIPWVTDADTALPNHPWSSLNDYSCAWGSLTTPGGAATVTNPATNWICYIGAGWNAGLGNTDPQPEAPTIVNNGTDNYEVAILLATPAHAVGLGLLTNNMADDTVTLEFADGTTLEIIDADLGTLSNEFEFVGFRSEKPIVKVTLVTTGGQSQNEGITGIWTSPFYIPPTTSCPSGQHFVTSVGSGSTTPVVSVPTASGYPYELTTSGTYFAGGTYDYDIQADAKFSQDASQRAALAPWTDLVNNYESYGPGLLEMTVDGAFVDWGSFSDSHAYTIPYVASGSMIDFSIDEVYAQNNTGGLCVDVEPVALRSLTAGGQIIADSADANDKHPYKVSFGGYIDDIDGGLECEWQLNLHNVSGTDLDKSKYHATTCTIFNTWAPGEQTPVPDVADGVANFTTWGTFNGDPGYRAIWRVEDRTEPSDLDTFRVTIYKGSTVVYDTTNSGDFPKDSNNVGSARTLLDRGNIQINFYE